MSFYNLLHGQNPIAPLLREILGLDRKIEIMAKFPEDKGDWDADFDEDEMTAYCKECIEKGYYPSGRYRDIYLNSDGTKIILYTRNGGGNRPYYTYVFRILRKHPNYIDDYDDDFDSTYAYIVFSVPEKFIALCQSLATGQEPKTIKEKLDETLNEIESMSKEDLEKDKRFKPIVDILTKISEFLKET